jgi:hypothetical protein
MTFVFADTTSLPDASVVVGRPVHADATVYVDEAAARLQSDNVFVSGEVRDADALAAALRQQIGDDSIGVAVFSKNAGIGTTPLDIAQSLQEQTTYDTIIVAVDWDLAAGSSTLGDEALRIANEADDQAESVASTLTETIQGIQAAAPAPGTGAGDSGIGGGAILGIVLAVVAVVAVIGVTIGVVRGRRGRARAERGLPDPVRAHLAALSAASSAYAAAGASGNQDAARTAREIDALVGNVAELFRRLDGRVSDNRSDGGQRQLAAVEYDDKLRKLSGALHPDYLLDILTHPNLWDDPAERQREVEGALSAVSQELVDNIKQVNARRALHFQVSLDGLMGRRKELQDWDKAFDTAAGDGPGQDGVSGSGRGIEGS